MQKKYGRLSFDERIEIEKILSPKKSYADIAMALNRSKSTIQRDIIKQGIKQYKAIEVERCGQIKQPEEWLRTKKNCKVRYRAVWKKCRKTLINGLNYMTMSDPIAAGTALEKHLCEPL